MKIFPLNKGRFCLVNKGDFDWLNQWDWYVNTCGYAVRNVIEIIDGVKKSNQQFMHRQIMNNPLGLVVDHIDGMRLNNCRSNLRSATISENARNRGHHRWGTSDFKGVHWHKKQQKWVAAITYDGRQRNIGAFAREEDAATAYNIMAEMHHGEFARMNVAITGSYLNTR